MLKSNSNAIRHIHRLLFYACDNYNFILAAYTAHVREQDYRYIFRCVNFRMLISQFIAFKGLLNLVHSIMIHNLYIHDVRISYLMNDFTALFH